MKGCFSSVLLGALGLANVVVPVIGDFKYCELPREPHVQPHDWEQFGPNGAMAGELRGWAMTNGCFASENPFCEAGQCMCIYACEPGYCMTQFNPSPSTRSIGDPSHGVRCNKDGTIAKIHAPEAPLCVPCTSENPVQDAHRVIDEVSPATIVSHLPTAVAACGLMDPGVDDNLQYGNVQQGSDPLFVSMFPQWWYLEGVHSQVYVGLPGVPTEYFCSTKRNPELLEPEGNAGFYSVAYTIGGGITQQPNGHFFAFGQVAFFGDFGNDGHTNLAKCWKHLQDKCVPDYGIKSFVCGTGQSIQDGTCALQCDINWNVRNLGNDGSSAQLCRQMKKCNLNVCPSPDECLSGTDNMGCNPVADITTGERIVYQLYSLSDALGEVTTSIVPFQGTSSANSSIGIERVASTSPETLITSPSTVGPSAAPDAAHVIVAPSATQQPTDTPVQPKRSKRPKANREVGQFNV